MINKFHGCKRFSIKAYPTQYKVSYRKIKQNKIYPLKSSEKPRKEIKFYIPLFTSSVSRAARLEVLQNQTTGELIKALKQLIARRERPQIIYSDNAKSFTSASKWVQKINKDLEFRDFLASNKIKSKFTVGNLMVHRGGVGNLNWWLGW